MQDGGKEAVDRRELWCRLLLEGVIGEEDHPVGFDYRSGRLPKTPVWADYVGENIKPPERGWGPAKPEDRSGQSTADGSVGHLTAMMRDMQQFVQQQQQQNQMMMMQMMQRMPFGGEATAPPPPATPDVSALLQNPAVLAALSSAMQQQQQQQVAAACSYFSRQ